jgi:ribosomal protein L15
MVKRTPFLRGKDRFDRLVQRYQIVTLTQLSKFSDKDEITADVLKARKIIRSASVPVKIIATGELKKAVTVRCLVSAGAKTAIERAGGSVILPEIVKPAELEKRVSKKAVKKEKYKAAKKAADKLAGK